MHAPAPTAPSLTTSALLDLGRAFASVWGRVAVQPTVVHDRLGPIIATHCALAAAIALLAGAWPTRALLVLVLIGMSMAADLGGGVGWTRALTPRRPNLNLIAWASDKPTRVLVVLPGDATPQRANLCLSIPLTAYGVAIFGAATAKILPAASAAALLGSSIALAGCCMLSLIGLMLLHGHPDVTTARAALRTMVRDIGERPGDITVALIGGTTLTGDGLATLLLNNRERLVPGHTKVICWDPVEGPIELRCTGGRLVDPAGPLARRAKRLGFTAYALCGGLHAPEAVGQRLATAATNLALASGGEE
jgi:hypothetical protein